MADTVVQELVVNTLTQAQFNAAKEAGTLSPYELYGTPDTSVRLPVLTPMWFDHIANDVSWLRADTFSWHSGDVYIAAYNHLAEEFASVSEWSYETVGGVYIGYKLMPDGHKITDVSSERYVQAIYEATGVAWYYILDTGNKQFKLPRTKWGFTGLRDSVGGYVAPGLPNITAYWANLGAEANASGAATVTTRSWGNRDAANSQNSGAYTLNASRSSSIYGSSTTVQPPATQMYLYFYVGNFEQDAVEQTAGINAEMFNDLNAHKVIEFQVPTADNGYTWYRKYADGWVEQGGIDTTGSGEKTITMPIVMQDDKYTVLTTTMSSTSTHNATVHTVTTTTFKVSKSNGTCYWQASGMAA